jgi:hypothetical protein
MVFQAARGNLDEIGSMKTTECPVVGNTAERTHVDGAPTKEVP